MSATPFPIIHLREGRYSQIAAFQSLVTYPARTVADPNTATFRASMLKMDRMVLGGVTDMSCGEVEREAEDLLVQIEHMWYVTRMIMSFDRKSGVT
jgi:hypothetical protein